jgi:hypothetical protein
MRQKLLQVLASAIGTSALFGCEDIRDPFDESFCTGGEIQLLANLKPAEPADYVALRRTVGASSDPAVIEEVGDCPLAVDCRTLEQPGGTGFQLGIQISGSEHVLAVRGEKIEYFLTAGELRGFLGTVDSPNEAALLVHASNYNLDCNDRNLDSEAGGFLIYAEKGTGCGDDVTGYQVFVATDGSVEERESEVVVEGDKHCQIGRLPHGLCDDALAPAIAAATPTTGSGERALDHRAPDEKAIGEHLAQIAFLEAAAVAAFEQLAAELDALGAPTELVERARRAAREETRHAILMRGLARRWGVEAKVPVVAPQALRDAFEIALDNAVEGLTRERFGALLALHQAHFAKDPLVRAVMQLVSEDEVDHAQFSQELHDWLWQRLSREQQRTIAEAQLGAIVRFRRAAHEPNPRLVLDTLGLPDSALALRLFDQLFRDVAPASA